MRGLTGVIKFDHQGFRSDFTLDIIELNREGLKKIGTWNSTEGVNFTRTYREVYTQIVEIIQNKTFVVTTILVIFANVSLTPPPMPSSTLRTKRDFIYVRCMREF